MIKLSDKQKQALSATRWLLSEADSDRRTGRSFLLTYVLLEHAKALANSNPDSYVKSIDHYLLGTFLVQRTHLMYIYKELYADRYDIDIKHSSNIYHFRLIKKKTLLDKIKEYFK